MSYELRISRKGQMSVAVGDGEPTTIDAIHVFDRWFDLDKTMRDESGKIPDGKWSEYGAAQTLFVREVLGVADVTAAEAREFIARLTERVRELRDFFVPKSQETPSSPASTAVNFSQ